MVKVIPRAEPRWAILESEVNLLFSNGCFAANSEM